MELLLTPQAGLGYPGARSISVGLGVAPIPLTSKGPLPFPLGLKNEPHAATGTEGCGEGRLTQQLYRVPDGQPNSPGGNPVLLPPLQLITFNQLIEGN